MDSLEGIMKAIMLQNGNENIVRFYDEKEDKSALLMEELAKLETTRNPEDIGLDSHNALVLATDVLEKAVADSKPADRRQNSRYQPESATTFRLWRQQHRAGESLPPGKSAALAFEWQLWHARANRRPACAEAKGSDRARTLQSHRKRRPLQSGPCCRYRT